MWDREQIFRFCAVIAINGKPVGVGFNDAKMPSNMQRPYEFLKRNEKPYKNKFIGLHAESAAILDARRRKCVDLSGAKIYVARIGAAKDNFGHTNVAMARPCTMCRGILRSAKIKKAFYTVEPEEYGVISLNKDLS